MIVGLSQMKDWHHETIVANQKSPQLLHDASLRLGQPKIVQCVSGFRAGRYIACDDHAHLVSKAGSVIGTKSPSPVFKIERQLIHRAVVH